jgi:ketosteroid isomerase-like protein
MTMACQSCGHASPATNRFCEYVATEEHGSLAVARTFGTLAAGGEFESVFARLLLYRDGRIGAVEQYELEHLEAARARFKELSGVDGGSS